MLAEWKETFLRFKINIVYRPGMLNIIPDTLSRAFPESVLKDDHHKQVTQSIASQSSKVLKKSSNIMSVSHLDEFLQSPPSVGSSDLQQKDWRVQSSASFAQNMMDDTEYLVPDPEKREELLTEVHSFGHYGHHAMIQDLHERGIKWNNMQKDCCDYVKSCITCQKGQHCQKGLSPYASHSCNHAW